MQTTQRLQLFREAAREVVGIDLAAYERNGRSATEPVIGEGNPNQRIAIFGRDPGRDEVQFQLPFIGAGGQKVRQSLYRYHHAAELPNFEASIEVGRHYYWANTVPYKPIGNKAWSMAVKKRFQPLVADLLVHEWAGDQLITLGREALFWFAINRDRSIKQTLERFWARDDRFTSQIEVELVAPDGHGRTISLYPLPHPSPLNASWYKRFPALLEARLVQLNPPSKR